MKLKKLAATTAATALIAGGMVFGVATAASAHTPSVSADCSVLDVSLTNYAAEKPGTDAVPPVYHDWSETVIDTPAVDAIPAVTHTVPHHDLVTAEIPAIPAKTHTEYEFKQIITGHTKWNADKFWNPGLGWYLDGNTKVVVDSPAVPAVPAVYHDWTETVVDSPAVDAVPAVTHEVPHHDLVTPGVDAVPGQANHVTVTIDGETVTDTDFGTSFVKSYAFDNKYVSHTYSVVATAWDDSKYDVNESGTTTACAVPVVDAQTAAALITGCGYADLSVTNPEAEWTDNKTGAVTVWVDGKFKEAISVAGDATETRHYTFAEDSGDHTIVVKNAEFAGGAVLAEATVSSDCIAPKPEDKIVTSDWVDGKYGCGDTTVTQSRTVTDTPYVLEGGQWVLDTENAVTKTEKHDRALTAAEIKALNCPVVVVVTPAKPSTPAAAAPAPKSPAPIALSSDDTLAHTGSVINAGGPLALSGLLLALGIIALAAGAEAKRRRTNRVSQSSDE
jgi:hypothetical protein